MRWKGPQVVWECSNKHHYGRRNDLGWFVYPYGLYELLVKLKRYRLPVIITENGTCASCDEDYRTFLNAHLYSVAKAINSGVNVRGYLWWSLLDNFEWDKGFKPRFGLIAVDFNNFSRRVRPFARQYKIICQANGLSGQGTSRLL